MDGPTAGRWARPDRSHLTVPVGPLRRTVPASNGKPIQTQYGRPTTPGEDWGNGAPNLSPANPITPGAT